MLKTDELVRGRATDGFQVSDSNARTPVFPFVSSGTREPQC